MPDAILGMARRDGRLVWFALLLGMALATAGIDARAAQVLYAFDTDARQTIRDWLPDDGMQDPFVHGQLEVDSNLANAGFGTQAVRFPVDPFGLNALEIPQTTNLGSAFTLAAYVSESTNDFSRLFSSYNGGPVQANELVFDMDPSNSTASSFGLRAIVNGTSVTRGVNFADSDYHHVALTYDDGSLRLFLDGTQLGLPAMVPGGAVNLATNLRFGEDYAPTSLTNEAFEGWADDILVYPQALSPAQIQSLAQIGASATLGATAPPPAPGPAPRALGSKIEMFVDDYLLESTNNVALKMHAPRKQETVFTANQQYESNTSAYYTILRDGDEIRMYYRGNVGSTEVTLLATSTDGIHFTRPDLGAVTIDGSSQNAVVWQGEVAHNLTPFIDTNPNALAQQRYKAVGGQGQLYALSSPDGIHWSLMQEEPLAMTGAFDSQNTAMWDAEAGLYRAFTREWIGGIRAIQMSTSTDFIHWTTPVPFQYDVPMEHFYTNGIIQAPGAEQIFLGFPMRFDPSHTNVPSPGQTGASDAVFITSRDGFRWDRTFSEPWIPEGFDTTRSNMPAWGYLELSPDEWSMYASEHYNTSNNSLRRLTVRPYGFASIGADDGGGSFQTPSLTFDGDALVLNFETQGAGNIAIQIEDEEGNPIPGFTFADAVPLSGDSLGRRFVWSSGRSVGELAGQVVRLNVQMTDADLFALQFAPEALLADLNRDGAVDIFDVNAVSDAWGTSSLAGDANRDGVVDIFDVNAISDHWTSDVGGAAVPEPASALLFCGGVALVAAARRRAGPVPGDSSTAPAGHRSPRRRSQRALGERGR